jgi:integrase
MTRPSMASAGPSLEATFRTSAEEVATFPLAVVEQAMGHQVGNVVERAYRRTDLLDQRRPLMDA